MAINMSIREMELELMTCGHDEEYLETLSDEDIVDMYRREILGVDE